MKVPLLLCKLESFNLDLSYFWSLFRYRVIQCLLESSWYDKDDSRGQVVAELSTSIRISWKVEIYYINGALVILNRAPLYLPWSNFLYIFLRNESYLQKYLTFLMDSSDSVTLSGFSFDWFYNQKKVYPLTYAEILFIYQLNSGKFLRHGPLYYTWRQHILKILPKLNEGFWN